MFSMPEAKAGFARRGAWIIAELNKTFGLTTIQAAGIVGNLGYESIGLRTLQEIKPLVTGSRGGYGWAQWTASRRVAFERWAGEHGLALSSDEANYGFLVHELKTSHAYCIAELREAATLSQAVFSFGVTFERPEGTTDTNLPGFSGRLRYARQAYSDYLGMDALMFDLQSRLKLLDLYNGALDRDPGPRTQAALEDWRKL